MATNRQQAARETRRKLVDAAKRIISEKGLSNTSVDEITEACGVAKGTFYTYFKRKEDIVFELSGEMFGEILLAAKERPGTALQKLEYYMVCFSGYIEKSSLKLAQEWVKNSAAPDLCADGKKKLEQDIADMRELLLSFTQSGELCADAPVDLLARTLTEALYGQMLCWCMSGGAFGFEERTRQFCQDCLPALLQCYLKK